MIAFTSNGTTGAAKTRSARTKWTTRSKAAFERVFDALCQSPAESRIFLSCNWSKATDTARVGVRPTDPIPLSRSFLRQFEAEGSLPRAISTDSFKTAPVEPASPATSASSSQSDEALEADVSRPALRDTPRTLSQDLDLFSLPDMDDYSDAKTSPKRPPVAGLFYGSRMTGVGGSENESPHGEETSTAGGGAAGAVQAGHEDEQPGCSAEHFDGARSSIKAAGAEHPQPPYSSLTAKDGGRHRRRKSRLADRKEESALVAVSEPESPTFVGDLPQTPTRNGDPETASLRSSGSLSSPARQATTRGPLGPHGSAASLVRHVAQQEALIAELRQQVTLLKEINELRDWELGHIGGQAEQLER